MSNQATLDPSLHTIAVLGRTITGFASDTGFSSTMDTNAFEKVVGNRGLGAYTRVKSGAATLTFTMMPTSNDNDFFSLLAQADANIPGGALVPFEKTTANGRTIESGSIRFQKMPDTSDGSSPIVWTAISLNYTKFVGGYEETPLFSTLDALQAAVDAALPIPDPV